MAFLSIPWFRRGPALSRQTVALEQSQKGNALWGANPDRLVAAVTAYHGGNVADLARIVDAYERQDDVAATGRMKRDASVARCEHTVLVEEGREDDPRAELHRKTLRRFWAGVRATSAFNRAERGGIRLLKKQMMDARSVGWSCHNIVWRAQGESLSAEFVHVPLWHFENLTGELRFRERATDWYGVPMEPGSWLVNAATPVGPAVALACCAKRMSLQDWMLFSERAATPGILGKTAAAVGSDAWNSLCEMIRRWGRDWRAVVDKDTDLTPVSLNVGSTPPMPGLVERMDRAIAALYRGADLSTLSKGEGLGASLQGDESDMLEADMCAEISEALHEQVDRYVIRYMTGDDEPLAYVWIEPVAKPDTDANIKIDDHLASFGVRLSKRDMLQRYGRAEAADAADSLEPPRLPGETGGSGTVSAPGTPPRALPNAQGRCKGGLTPLQNARRDPDGQGDGFAPDAPEAVFRAFAEGVGTDAEPLAREVRKLLDLIDAGDEAGAAAFAASLGANVGDYLPEDPAGAMVLAEAMAQRYGEAWEAARAKDARLANEQARGKTVPGTNSGSFAPEGGTSATVERITAHVAPRIVKHEDARAALTEGFTVSARNTVVQSRSVRSPDSRRRSCASDSCFL